MGALEPNPGIMIGYRGINVQVYPYLFQSSRYETSWSEFLQFSKHSVKVSVAEFANSVDLDEAAHYYCLLSSL